MNQKYEIKNFVILLWDNYYSFTLSINSSYIWFNVNFPKTRNYAIEWWFQSPSGKLTIIPFINFLNQQQFPKFQRINFVHSFNSVSSKTYIKKISVFINEKSRSLFILNKSCNYNPSILLNSIFLMIFLHGNVMRINNGIKIKDND